jgi:hypothetical protein
MNAKGKRRRRPTKGPHHGRVTSSRPPSAPHHERVKGYGLAAPPVTIEFPLRNVTEYVCVTAVPVFADGESGPPSGSQGQYDIVYVLGVPGLNSIATSLNMEQLLTEGDSRLEGKGLKLDLQGANVNASNVRIIPNSQGRLAQVRLSVEAASFSSAEKAAYDEIMPILSRLAFEADTSLEVTAIIVTEVATEIRSMGANVIGAIKPAPEIEGIMSIEIRPYLAAYREGLNSNSPLYQALCFFKIIEGVATFSTKRTRASLNSGGGAIADPLSKRIPSDLTALPDMMDWDREIFRPYFGKTFAEIKASITDTIRNAIAHLTPGRDIRIADHLDDVHACRNITPVLRYIARVLIEEELASMRSGGRATTP